MARRAETVRKIMNKKSSLKTLLLVIVVAFGGFALSAQTVHNLNSTSTQAAALRGASASITTEFPEAKVARSFAINPALQRAGSVSVGDIIALQLFEESTFTAFVRAITTEVNGNFTLSLSLPDYPFASGFITTGTNGNSLVSVSIPERNQEFSSRTNVQTRTSYLIQVDENLNIRLPSRALEIPIIPTMEEVDGGMRIGSASTRSTANCTPWWLDIPGTAPATIDLLVVYTAAAATWAASRGGINNVIAGKMARTREVVDNQRDGDEIRLVHSQRINFSEQSMDMGSDLWQLIRHRVDVHQLRRQYNADLVMLLGVYYDFGGMAWLLNNATMGNIDFAFSITRVQQADNSFTAIHEIGHNMGMLHNVEDNQHTSPFPYAFGWHWLGTDGNRYGSVMSYRGITVPFFSNPNETAFGRPTGTATANNAQVFRNIKHIIAAYSDRLARTPDAPTNVVVSNPTMHGTTISWDAMPNAAFYRLYLEHDHGWWWLTHTTTELTWTFDLPTHFSSGQTYRFFVTAVNECNDQTGGQIFTFRTRSATDPWFIGSPNAEDVTALLVADGTLTISGTGNMQNFGRSIFPWDSQIDDIKTIIIREGVANIGQWAFSYCASLTSITIPRSVATIGDGAFWDCTALTSVTFLNPNPPAIGVNIFGGVNTENITFTVPFGSGDAYRAIEGWSGFNIVEAAEIFPVTSVSLDRNALRLSVGDTETLIATIYPENATNQTVSWSSSNTAVATIDEDGVITALAEGITTITVTTEDGEFTATCEVAVEADYSWLLIPAMVIVEIEDYLVVRVVGATAETFNHLEVATVGTITQQNDGRWFVPFQTGTIEIRVTNPSGVVITRIHQR